MFVDPARDAGVGFEQGAWRIQAGTAAASLDIAAILRPRETQFGYRLTGECLSQHLEGWSCFEQPRLD